MVSPLEDEIHPLLLVYSHQTIDSIWGWDFPNYQYKDMLASQEPLVQAMAIGFLRHMTVFYFMMDLVIKHHHRHPQKL